MIPEDRRQAEARLRVRSRAATRDAKNEQIGVLVAGATALLLFLLF